MSLVRSLILAETSVAVDAVCAILDCKMCYVAIIFPNLTYQLFAEIMPFGKYFLIAILIGCEPLLIIIARKIAQEL